jgi:hypothetical protein
LIDSEEDFPPIEKINENRPSWLLKRDVYLKMEKLVSLLNFITKKIINVVQEMPEYSFVDTQRI